jgi:hypothetical protein
MSRALDKEHEVIEVPAGWDPVRWQKWMEECDRREARMDSGEDRALTLEEFWSDDDID